MWRVAIVMNLKSNPVQLIQILASVVLRNNQFSVIIQAERWLTQAGVSTVLAPRLIHKRFWFFQSIESWFPLV